MPTQRRRNWSRSSTTSLPSTTGPAPIRIGKRMRLGTPEMQTPWLTVVGEVADVKEISPDVQPRKQYYQPVEQFEKSVGPLGSPDGSERQRMATSPCARRWSPSRWTNGLRATVRSIDPQLPLVPGADHGAGGLRERSASPLQHRLISAFAGAAVLLAALGIYSVIAFSAALRVQEMAIRMALGSQRSGILSLVFQLGCQTGACGLRRGIAGRRGSFADHAVVSIRSEPVRSAGAHAGGCVRVDPGPGGRVSTRAPGCIHRSDESAADGLNYLAGTIVPMMQREILETY